MAAPFPSPTATWHDNTYPSISPSRPELSAKGKRVLITGGGSGIGAETARSFAEAGAARIALVGRREQPLLDTKASINKQYPSVEVFTHPLDISITSDVNTVFDKFVGDGKLDILVAAASMIGPQEFIADVDVDKFMNAIDTNLRGTLNIARAFQHHASADAVVVDINSSAATVNFAPAFSCYNTSKFATFKIWDSLGAFTPNMRHYSIQPGVVNTDMNKEAGGVKAMGFEDHVSLPANFIVWLASHEATFLKGKFLWANWDVDELKAQQQEIEKTRKFNLELVGWPFGAGEYVSGWDSDKK